jgi:hypothetical protein
VTGGHFLASVPSAHWEGKAIRAFLTAMASAVALCGCAAQPMHWAKPDTAQVTFKQRWAQDTFKQDTFKQRLGETSHPRRGKKDRGQLREAAGATAEAFRPWLTKE